MISDCQMGFSPNRSTIDTQPNLHNVFVDFKQAFDSVNRSPISECLKKYKIPKKLIRLTALVLKNTTAKVKINNELSESLIVNTGVKPAISAIVYCDNGPSPEILGYQR
jgi:hypothetical protein